MKKLNRLYNQLYAFIFGYYWLPCPLCGDYMGGHEEKGKTIIYKDETLTSGFITCKKHKYEESIIRKMN